MSKKPAALDIKSANLYALRVVLHDADTDSLTAAIRQRMAESGSLFENEPVIIDASRLADDAVLDWAALSGALRKHKLPPIGVVATGVLQETAAQAGLTPLELSVPSPRPAQASADDVTALAATATPGMVVTHSLRSGQRVYANDGDLVIIGGVNQGAEVIADGNIHVYGPLRGKAMAGARGNTSARIFTTHLAPELLGIAGIYRVVENKLDDAVHARAAQVWLSDESLEIHPL